MYTTKDTTSGGFHTDFGMFTTAGNSAVADIVREAQQLAGVDGPKQPLTQALEWMYNELKFLAEHHFEEADDTAVREAAYIEFIKDED
jgi:hypothetical protein